MPLKAEGPGADGGMTRNQRRRKRGAGMLCSLMHSQRKETPKAGRMEPENPTCGPVPVELESSTPPTDRGRGLA